MSQIPIRKATSSTSSQQLPKNSKKVIQKPAVTHNAAQITPPVVQSRHAMQTTTPKRNARVVRKSEQPKKQSSIQDKWWMKKEVPIAAATNPIETIALKQEREDMLRRHELLVEKDEKKETSQTSQAPTIANVVAAQKETVENAPKPVEAVSPTKQEVTEQAKPIVVETQQAKTVVEDHRKDITNSESTTSRQSVVLTQMLPPPPPPATMHQEVAQITSRVLIGIICHNDESYIGKTIVRLQSLGGQVLVCDDGSTDLTDDIARKMGGVVIKHPRPLGRSESISSLFLAARRAKPEVLLTIPAASQFNLIELTKVISAVENEECDIAIGSMLPPEATPPIEVSNKVDSTIRAYSRKAIELIAPLEYGSLAVEEDKMLGFAIEKNLKVKQFPMTLLSQRADVTKTEEKVVEKKSWAESFVSKIVHLATRERPLIFFGLPAIAFFAAAVFQTIYTLYVVSTQKYIPQFGIQIAFSLLLVAAVLAVGSALLVSQKEVQMEEA